MRITLSARRAKLCAAVRAASERPSHWLVEMLKELQLRTDAARRKATVLSRSACPRARVCRNLSGLPYVQHKHPVGEKLDI
jgi:hypothetical protein